jgi:hypothetical protein
LSPQRLNTRGRGPRDRPRPAPSPLTLIFALAIFLSATLLFTVQPLIGKTLLPVLGGSPAVWGGCLVFFQTALLLGYVYAYALSTHVSGRWQWLIHVGVLIAAGLMLRLTIDVGEPGDGDPRWWMLRALTVTVGLPFFALSATAPLVQHWFSRTADPRASDPYFLYAASNAGSLVGLLGYLAVEPFATRYTQATGWTIGFWMAAAFVTASAYASISRVQDSPPDTRDRSHSPITPVERALWIALALVPSALLLGVTQHLATDVASVPLLWVVPLALYLLTLIVAFSPRGGGSARRWGMLAPVAVLTVLALSLAEVRYPILLVTLIHLAAFAVLAMLCHTRLAERRPDAAHLTGYFVCVSLGGVLGGIAAALVAPAVFSSVLEYPLALAAALLLRPQNASATTGIARLVWYGAAVLLVIAGYWGVPAFDRAVSDPQLAEITQRLLRASLVIPAGLLLLSARAALLFAGAAAGLLVGAGTVRTGGDVIARERTFFGVHQVTSVQGGEWHILTHGTTTHGIQAIRGQQRSLPTAYYHPSGPLGDIVFTLAPDARFRDVAAIGLGAGALAAYANNGTRMDFFEVDPAVIRFAEDGRLFTYLADARVRGAQIRTIATDGRLGLRAMPAASYDLIVVDAFSSDAIPTHLITREAIEVNLSRLKPRGLMAFHVSSRFFDLPPVLARIAADRGLVSYVRHDNEVPPERAAEAMRASVWVVLARDASDVGQLARAGPRWVQLASNPSDPLWTDDYTNVLGALQ